MNFSNAYIFNKNFTFEHGNFSVENGKFTNVFGPVKEDTIDLHGAYVIPGLIDIHTHGNSDHDFSDGNYDGLVEMARYYAANGITSFAPTSLTLPFDVLNKAFSTAVQLQNIQPEGTAQVLGIHMEGPFFCEARKGAQNAEHLHLPDYKFFSELNNNCCRQIRLVDVAPELEGSVAFIREACQDATVSVAHTDSDYDHAAAAFDAGATHITHLFNGMPSIHHRKPGPIIAAAENPNVTAELIGDGLHVHPACVRFAFRLFGPDRMVIISDSLRCCGMPDGEYSIGGLKCFLSGGVARLEDGTIAGSATNVYDCMLRVISFGVKKEDAIRAATFNPARQLNCLDKVGSIEDGKSADFVICDEDLTRRAVYLRGNKLS